MTALLRHARDLPFDAAVRDCCELVVRGIESGWLDRAELRELVEHLRARKDFGVEELLFAHAGDQLRVSFLNDQATCLPHLLIAELAALLQRL